MSVATVDTVLNDVRPYLIADGGDVEVVSVEDGVVSLRLQVTRMSLPACLLEKDTDGQFAITVKSRRSCEELFQFVRQCPALQGACGTCASSSATMKMGIERALQVRKSIPAAACISSNGHSAS